MLSHLALVLVYLVGVAAIAAALQGAVLTLRSYAGEGRVLARRMTRAQPGGDQPVADQTVDETQGALARIIDARAPWIRRRLATARAPFTPTQVVGGAVVLFLLFFLVMRLAGVPGLVALAAAAWGGFAGPLALLSWMAARRRARFVTQMPTAIDLMARSLQAGHPVTTAMSVAARQMPDPTGPEFAIVIAEMQYGLDRDAALRNLLQRFPIPELRMFVASLEVTRETGGNLAEVFLKLGETLRAKAQLRKKVAAISAEGKMTFWVVSALPFLVGAAITLLNPGYYRDVVGDPLFWPLMSIPPLLLLIGGAVIWRMINFRI